MLFAISFNTNNNCYIKILQLKLEISIYLQYIQSFSILAIENARQISKTTLKFYTILKYIYIKHFLQNSC